VVEGEKNCNAEKGKKKALPAETDPPFEKKRAFKQLRTEKVRDLIGGEKSYRGNRVSPQGGGKDH